MGPAAHRTKAQRNWNLAADAEINDDLVAGDAVKPAAAVTPSALGLPDSLTAEEYWAALGGPEQADAAASEPNGPTEGSRLRQRL